jgi:hypothetical protein
MFFPGSNIRCFTFYIHLWPTYWLSLVCYPTYAIFTTNIVPFLLLQGCHPSVEVVWILVFLFTKKPLTDVTPEKVQHGSLNNRHACISVTSQHNEGIRNFWRPSTLRHTIFIATQYNFTQNLHEPILNEAVSEPQQFSRQLSSYFVGFEALTAVVMESSIFWDITPCSP